MIRLIKFKYRDADRTYGAYKSNATDEEVNELISLLVEEEGVRRGGHTRRRD